VTPATALVLLGLGLGTLIAASPAQRRTPSLRERADTLRAQTSRAQEASARASSRARELMDQWSAAEDAARKARQ